MPHLLLMKQQSLLYKIVPKETASHGAFAVSHERPKGLEEMTG